LPFSPITRKHNSFKKQFRQFASLGVVHNQLRRFLSFLFSLVLSVCHRATRKKYEGDKKDEEEDLGLIDKLVYSQ
jgi:hypothetical protein